MWKLLQWIKSTLTPKTSAKRGKQKENGEMRLSKHFTQAEFEKSQTAIRKGINNRMTAENIKNAKALCEHVLEPAREHFGLPIAINSGYRGDRLNRAIGGVNTSQHKKGEAADIELVGGSNWDLFRFIRDNLPYDQLIAEYMVNDDPRAGWVHVSYRAIGNREMAFSIGGADVGFA